MIRLGIFGYGNLARGVESAIRQNPDMELCAVFTRREPETVKILTPSAAVTSAREAPRWQDRLDVMILCGGSATDLPKMTPDLARLFHVVDSYDNHAHIPEHFAAVDAAATAAKKTALISCGWDPGMFSLNRLYDTCILPDGSDYTFWGRGVSQGHSDAIRRIEGVADARQYTVPVPEALDRVRRGERPVLRTGEKHRRECYVVAAEGADLKKIRRSIVTMPDYFADYETSVTFVTAEELHKNHAGLPHGGHVIRTGTTGVGEKHNQVIDYSLRLESNPEFTGSVLTAFARAVYRMARRGDFGCKTVFDVAPADLAIADRGELIAHLL